MKIKVCVEFEGLVFLLVAGDRDMRRWSRVSEKAGKAAKCRSGRKEATWRFGSTKRLAGAGLAEHGGIPSARMLLNIVAWNSEIGLPLSPELLGLRRVGTPSVLLSVFVSRPGLGYRVMLEQIRDTQVCVHRCLVQECELVEVR